jgi:AcrR family transcriptional regulator
MKEDNDLMTLADAAQEVGLQRASLYYYIRKLAIVTHRYELNKHTYISRKDVERIQAVKERPWKVSKEKSKADDTLKMPAVKKA